MNISIQIYKNRQSYDSSELRLSAFGFMNESELFDQFFHNECHFWL